ncbi:ISL3 family transposase [Elizabethkingia anophelis]|uniref:ISL3 family transposase n=1 Tax=Elizabethkingia anophelis TaxID=1117645 RepID=UPI00320853CD
MWNFDTQRNAFWKNGQSLQLFFERLIMSKSLMMSVSAMGREIWEPDNNLWRVIRYYVKQGLDHRKHKYLRKIAVDEKAYKKGHEYVSIFTDLDTGEVVFVTPGRKKEVFEEFKAWLLSLGLEPQHVELFSMDMSKSYGAGRAEYFPESKVVFDRFHIKKLLNELLDKVRKREVKTNNKLMGTKYLWLKNEQNLTENQQNQMKELYDQMNIDTVKAYHQKQFFDSIWNASGQKVESLLQFWIAQVEQSHIKEMLTFVKSLKKNWDGIVNAMKTKITNAVSEGINSNIQLSKFRARGFRNMHNFISCIYLINANLKFNFHN